MAYFLLAAAFTFNAVANILLKLGAKDGLDLSSYSPVHLVASNWQFFLGLVIFAMNVFLYFLALRSLPLSIAYPIMVVMSFVIVNGYAFFALGESITFFQVIGYAAIVLGLVLVVAHQ